MIEFKVTNPVRYLNGIETRTAAPKPVDRFALFEHGDHVIYNGIRQTVYRMPQSAPVADADGWHPWKAGDGRPAELTDDETLIEIRVDGEPFYYGARPAVLQHWGPPNAVEFDAWRYAKPAAPEPEVETWKTGKPPSVGWYVAHITRCETKYLIRWWDGSGWSTDDYAANSSMYDGTPREKTKAIQAVAYREGTAVFWLRPCTPQEIGQ